MIAAVGTVVTALAVQAAQVPVRLVITPDDGVPSAGVTRVGEVAATGEPVPVVAVKEGAAVDPVKLPNAVLADCVSKVAATVPEVVTALEGVEESTTPSPVKVTLVTVPVPGVIVLHPNPVPLVHVSALVAVLHDGTEPNVGPADDPVKFPNKVFAAAFDNVNVSAGVVVAVATEVVNNGDRFPAENEVTVPPPPPENVHGTTDPVTMV